MSRRGMTRRGPGLGPSAAVIVGRGEAVAASWAHWFRADTAVASGGNLVSLSNRGTAGGTVAVSSGVVAQPSADPALRGRPSFRLTGTQWLDSSLAAAAWRFPHDGTGFWGQVVFVPEVANTQVLLGTRGVGTGAGVHVYQTSNAYGLSLSNASTLLYNITGAAGVVGTGACIGATYVSANTPKAATYDRGIQVASSNAAGAPATGDPTAAMRIGASVDNAVPFQGRVAEVFIHTSIPSAAELTAWRAYLAALYGI